MHPSAQTHLFLAVGVEGADAPEEAVALHQPRHLRRAHAAGRRLQRRRVAGERLEGAFDAGMEQHDTLGANSEGWMGGT